MSLRSVTKVFPESKVWPVILWIVSKVRTTIKTLIVCTSDKLSHTSETDEFPNKKSIWNSVKKNWLLWKVVSQPYFIITGGCKLVTQHPKSRVGTRKRNLIPLRIRLVSKSVAVVRVQSTNRSFCLIPGQCGLEPDRLKSLRYPRIRSLGWRDVKSKEVPFIFEVWSLLVYSTSFFSSSS